MTTTAATSSASKSAPNDFPIQDNNGASEQILLDQQQQQLQPTTPQQPSSQQTQPQQQSSNQSPQQSNSSEQKRPMNAFLLFCKRQRSLVREKYPNLENRGITRILGDWWTKLDKEQKSKYTDLARQHKEAFMKANPDFKWCKTPAINNTGVNNNSNINNSTSNSTSSSSSAGSGSGGSIGVNANSNIGTSNNNNNNHNTNNKNSNSRNNSNSNDYFTNDISNNNRQLESTPPPTNLDIVQSNSRDSLTNNIGGARLLQQHEAPKPPKKRFLERNDSIYTNRSNSLINDANSHAKDGVVPLISLDQDTLDRVIDEAFSEESSKSPLGSNMCKYPLNRISTTTNLSSSSIDMNSNPSFSASKPSSYSTNIDEPVDFSMNRTINATRQQIINNLVEKMLSGPSDDASSTPQTNGTDQSQSGSPVKRDNQEET